MERSFEEDLDRLLKGAFSKGTGVNPVDSMPRDSCQDAPVRHDIAESAEMAIVDVDIVGTKYYPELTDKAQSGGFDSKHSESLPNRVGSGPLCINTVFAKHLFEGHAVSLDEEAARLVCLSASFRGPGLRIIVHFRDLGGL